MTAEHREVRLPYPDAALGSCRVCGQPCAPGRRSHRDCRVRFRDLRDYRGATLRDNGERCAKCGTTVGPFHADHITPLIDGGSKESWNRQVLCEGDHQAKTNREATARAAANRGEPMAQDQTFDWRMPAGLVLTAVAAAHLLGQPRIGTAILAVSAVLAALVWWVRQRAARRTAALDALRLAIGKVTGMSLTAPRLLVVRKWEASTPVKFTINYDPAVFDDDDPEQQERLTAAVRRRTGRADLVATWEHHLSRVTYRASAEPVAMVPVPQDSSTERERAAMTARLDAAIRGFVKTGDPRLRVTEWGGDGPLRITIDYPATFRDDKPEDRAGLQGVVNAKAGGGRWRCDWDTSKDRVEAVRRPVMPVYIAHRIDADLDPWRIPFATDEEGHDVVWDLDKKPHMLIAGGTGSGKTVVIRTIITACARRGFEIRCNDPKRIELSGLRGWPNVLQVETQTEPMCDLTESMFETMDRRYAEIEAGADPASMRPILFVVDEAREWIDRANVWWKANKARLKLEGIEGGTEHPSVEQWRSIARLGRSARVFILVGIQRPDAKVFGGEARDNFGARVACGQMSTQGSQMMFDDGSVGTDLPEDAKGRATVDVGNGPREAQCWWTPDPERPGYKSPQTEAADRALLAALRPEVVEPEPVEPEPEQQTAPEPEGTWETVRADALFVTQRIRVRGQEGVLLGSKTIGRDEDRLVLDVRGVGPVEVAADDPVDVYRP